MAALCRGQYFLEKFFFPLFSHDYRLSCFSALFVFTDDRMPKNIARFNDYLVP
jgi:hypothetical protein